MNSKLEKCVIQIFLASLSDKDWRLSKIICGIKKWIVLTIIKHNIIVDYST